MVAELAPTRSWSNGPDLSGKRRLVADRFRRIWRIVETIAETPGLTRGELADRFHLSVRQVQADLEIVRTDMRLPLIRCQGYRFVQEGPAAGDAGALDLREGQLLVMILRGAMRDRSVPRDRLDTLFSKLPHLFAPHLQPLLSRTLEAVMAPQSGQGQQVFAALADGLLRNVPVRLHYPLDAAPPNVGASIVIRPELLLPYLDSWYVVAEAPARTPGYPSRRVMLNLDHAVAVTLPALSEDAHGPVTGRG